MSERPMVIDSRERRALVDSALATLRIEGLEPSDDVKAVAERFVAGELSPEDLDRALERLLGSRQVHVS